jgi:hypothetical protein
LFFWVVVMNSFKVEFGTNLMTQAGTTSLAATPLICLGFN